MLYRKYRPRDFSEVVGQDHIITVIRRQVAAGRVAHAYLFSGPRGVGKTTVARLIAKAVNCERRGAQYVESRTLASIPCNTCVSCDTFNAGTALNLIEIDAASNRGIDEIRELREAVRFAPASGGTKVYIIDECHQLTKDAANALLKTLEEPPSHVVFVLATTELDKVPPTIVSRTQYFDFRRPRADVLAGRLTTLAEREGAKLEPDAAAAIAFAAEGSVRDAESMLGKILAVEDKTVTIADAEEVLGIPKREALAELFGHIGARRLPGAIELVNRLYRDGYEMEYLMKILITFFRDALLVKTGSAVGAASLLPDARELSAELAKYSADGLANATVELIEALASSRRSPIPQLPLELALIAIMNGRSSDQPLR
ncbi:MAG: DNA polymerase III subunit gamma/tau [bacterium]|nr:DNA polymerase III subunit gamma/tau [bacterium]